MNLFRNTFIQALGVAAFIYLLFKGFDLGLKSILSALNSFSNWYRFHGVKWAEEVAITCGLTFLLFAAVINSKNR